MSYDDFWTSLTSSHWAKKGSMDMFLAGDAPTPDPVIEAPTDQQAPVGLRVAFKGSLESLMSYRHPPQPGMEGTVVMVRTAMGDRTGDMSGRVYVKWDNNHFEPILARHLTLASQNRKKASSVAKMSKGAMDLNEFLKLGGDSQDLVHKATQDLWSLKTSPQGEVYLARLFNEDGQPIKL